MQRMYQDVGFLPSFVQKAGMSNAQSLAVRREWVENVEKTLLLPEDSLQYYRVVKWARRYALLDDEEKIMRLRIVEFDKKCIDSLTPAQRLDRAAKLCQLNEITREINRLQVRAEKIRRDMDPFTGLRIQIPALPLRIVSPRRKDLLLQQLKTAESA